MKKFLKFLLYVLIWIVITGVAVGVALFLGETWETGLKLAGTLFIIWALFIIIRKLILRRKAKKRVESLVDIEGEGGNNLTNKTWLDKLRSFLPEKTGLVAQFNKFHHMLHQTALKRLGDPMYVLPWYLMLGAKNSGKSTALSYAKLPAPLFDTESLKAEGSLSWCPYNEAVVVDTPGAYLDKSNRDAYKEWNAFLRLLEKRRRKEPLNGIVMTVDAKYLMETEENEIFEAGRIHQSRIDELMKTLKIKVPIYLMITKCNYIDGFVEYTKTLDKKSLAQAKGFAQEEDKLKAEHFVPKAFQSIQERVKDFMMRGINFPGVSKNILLLPKRLAELKERTILFTNGAFQENPYQENPFLRGLYLSGVEEIAKENQPKKGLFLHDFFTRILPADRKVLGSLATAERAEIYVRRMMMGGWTMFIAFLIAILVWVKTDNVNFIQNMIDKNAGAFVMKESNEEKVDAFKNLQKMITTIDYEVDSWWIPWYNLWERPDFIKKMQAIYADRFRKEMMSPLQEKLKTELVKAEVKLKESKVSKEQEYQHIARKVDTFVRRINVLSSFLDGKGLAGLEEIPAPFAEGGLYFKAGTNELFLEEFNGLYLQSLVWTQDLSSFKEERKWLQEGLEAELKKVSKDLMWVVPLANDEVKADGEFSLESYWVGTGALKKKIKVPGAFTLQGKEFIEGFIDRLIMTNPNSETFKEMKGLFANAYKKAYLKAWEDFAISFDDGINTLRGRGEWVDSVDLIATRHNPYFKALNVFAQQLEPYSSDEKAPEWVKLVAFYQKMKNFSPDEADGGNNKVLTKLALKAAKKLGPIGKAISKSGKSAMKTQKKLGAGKSEGDRDLVLEDSGLALGNYRKALKDVAFNANSRAVSMRAMESMFNNPNEPGAGEGPEAAAYKAIRKLETLIGKNSRQTRPFWKLYAGPMNIVKRYMLAEASCLLQSKWRQSFLVEIEGVPKYKRGGLMFGEEGQLWTFINEHASAFMVRQYRKGYVPRYVDGFKMPFTGEFIKFVTLGVSAKSKGGKGVKAKVPQRISVCWR